jgi:glycogen debranching enzyme
MDTNFPAGSPRQGYPVEIQALWHATLLLLSRIEKKESRKWRTLAEQVQASLRTYFWKDELGSCLIACT